MPCQVNRTSLYTLNGVANTRKIEIRPLCPNCPGGGGETPYKSDGDARRLALGCRLQILVSFGVFGMESYYISPFRYRLVLCIKKVTKNALTLTTQKSPLGVSLSLSHTHIGLKIIVSYNTISPKLGCGGLRDIPSIMPGLVWVGGGK